MKRYILIIVAVYVGNYPSEIVIPFTSAASCEAAKTRIVNDIKTDTSGLLGARHGKVISAHCHLDDLYQE